MKNPIKRGGGSDRCRCGKQDPYRCATADWPGPNKRPSAIKYNCRNCGGHVGWYKL